MSELRKAVLLAFSAIVLLIFWLSGELRYLRPYWRVVVHGSVRPGSAWTNLEALGLLFVGLFLVLVMLALLMLRRITYRESGGMLLHTHRELERDIRAAAGLQRRL